jgi:hypothetical protein
MANSERNFRRLRYWDKNRNIKDTDIELKMWGMSGYKCWDTDFAKHHEEGTIASPPEDLPDFPGITDGLKDQFKFSEVKTGDLIMPWMGYIDCRNYIPKYDDAKEVVERYVENTLNFFEGSKVRFIEPFPQFHILGTHNYPESYSYEEKTKANYLFIEYLHEYSSKAGLMEPVSQSLVYEAIGTNQLTKRYAKQGGEYHEYTLIDALRAEDNKKIYDALIPKIVETVSHYNKQL